MPIAKEGIPFIAVPALLMILFAAFAFWIVAAAFLLLTLFMLYFFRDPERTIPAGSDIIVSPADGRVTRVQPVAPGNPDSATVVSIFLSPLDVHINRSPIAGNVTDVTYTRGKFLIATSEKASLMNEQNALTIKGDRIEVVCKQIAGIVARRIVCWKQPGDTVELGQRIGLIEFSSRTDLILPSNVSVMVREGARVKGGLSIIGRIHN